MPRLTTSVPVFALFIELEDGMSRSYSGYQPIKECRSETTTIFISQYIAIKSSSRFAGSHLWDIEISVSQADIKRSVIIFCELSRKIATSKPFRVLIQRVADLS